MDTTIKIIRPDDIADFYALLQVFEEVFEMDTFIRPPESRLRQLLQRDTFYPIAATVDGRIVAGLTVYVIEQYYMDKPLAYIYDLAVLESHQRKGIGSQLIAFTKEHFSQRGFAGVFVQAEKVDDYAIDFYRTTRPSTEEAVVHFYYNLQG